MAVVPEVGLGLALERFTLVRGGEVFCVIDIVANETGSMVLNALPDFPLDIEAENARKFIAAWRQRAELQGESYEVRQEQRGL